MAADVRATAADIPMGMTEVEDGDHKVLFIRDANGLRAFESSCPHYGAPLAKGRICGRTLYCPWHKAAFDIGDGSLVEPPALHGLKQFPIRMEGEIAVATLEPLAVSGPSTRADTRTFVIVGTGAAAIAAVTTLRHEGFGGKLVMVGREAVPPYDRPALSKTFLAKKTDPMEVVLEADLYATHDVEFVMGPATRIEPSTRRVTLADGQTLQADAVLVATGSTAVVPPFAGGDLDGIFTLRSLADATALSEAAEAGRQIVIVGGGFIALEAAAFLTKRGLAATIISPEPLPLADRFGDDVAHALKVYHEGTGVRFIQGKVARFEGGGSVDGVRLVGGDVIATDLVLIAAGARPETTAIDAPKRDDGGIDVGETLELAPGVWLAGDIAAFPDSTSEEVVRIEHWRLAQQHGRHAARGMLGAPTPFVDTPYFWSNQGPKRLDYVGHASGWDRIVTKGDPATLDFIAYYVRGYDIVAACAIGRDHASIAILDRLKRGTLPLSDLEDVA